MKLSQMTEEQIMRLTGGLALGKYRSADVVDVDSWLKYCFGDDLPESLAVTEAHAIYLAHSGRSYSYSVKRFVQHMQSLGWTKYRTCKKRYLVRPEAKENSAL